MQIRIECVSVCVCSLIISFTICYRLYVYCRVQNYFGDPWNVLDFVIVIGSIVDIAAGRLLVSAAVSRMALNLTGVHTNISLSIYHARWTNAFNI